MHVPEHPDANDIPDTEIQEPDWADLEDLGVPYVEPEDENPRRGRGVRTLVALGLAAAVVAGGVALAAPTISKALGGNKDKPHAAAATPTPTLISDEELAAAASPKKKKPKPKPTPTPSESTQPSLAAPEAAPVGPNVASMADAAWVKRVAAKANIPERAMASYAGASLRVAQLRPSCNLGWNTLAAIGNVESHHGSINNNTLGMDGKVTPGIFGIALDGSDKVAAIKDTDQGLVDGDKVWDRAVGPMQFIPSTWAKVKQDGSGDGFTDVQQLDDAALSAGIYLCDAAGDMSNSEHWIKAIAAYNPSLQYNNDIARIATFYAGLN